MGRFKYILALLLFFSAVACGVSVVLFEFNHMIRPAGPVTAFSIEGTGPGVYCVEFLGEKITADFPARNAKDIFPGDMVGNIKTKVNKTFLYAAGIGEKVLKEILDITKNIARKTPVEIFNYLRHTFLEKPLFSRQIERTASD